MNALDEEGEVALIVGSTLFDRVSYEAEAGRSFASDRAAAEHYLRHGASAGLNPSRLFDGGYYLRFYRDVREAGQNPLLHYLRFGAAEGRTPRSGAGLLSRRPVAPSLEQWRALASERTAPGADAPVEIVVPVYRGYDDTLACLHSVLTSANATPYRLLVIDDAGPDPRLARMLDWLAALGLIRLLRNERNLGFVRTVNRGMEEAGRRDVLLLNADTVVSGDWLDRLRFHQLRGRRVGTVTPMSNNATILSYPVTCQPNTCDLERPHAELDRLFAAVNQGRSTEVPTGIGFCFLIARALLDAIGPMDAERFGRGYGEENDFCLRAAAAGWRNLAALDVYVRHTGEVSFSASAESGKAEGLRLLVERHPDYPALIDRFLRSDPIRPARQRIDLARAGDWSGGNAVLLMEHGWGGGLSRHVKELGAHLEADGFKVLRSTPADDGRSLRLETLFPADLPNLPPLPLQRPERAGDILRRIGLRHAHVHSLVGHDIARFADIRRMLTAAGVSYDFTAHDFAALCPRITMIDWGGSFCNTPSGSHCAACVARVGTPFGPVDVKAWRQAYRDLLGGARLIFVPHEDVAERLRANVEHLPPVLVRPHPEPATAGTPPPARVRSRRLERSVALIGAIGAHKGSRVLLAAAADALQRRLPLRFVVFGHTDLPELERFPNVRVTGAYAESAIDGLLADDPCDLALFPSVWPETFCYTLSIAFRNGLYPLAFDLGAPAARIRASGFGEVLPRGLIYAPAALNDRLLAARPAPPPATLAVAEPWLGADAYYGTLPPTRPGAALAGTA